MTAPDPVVVTLEAIGRHSAVAGYDGGDATTYALAYAALPLARAQAALVAAAMRYRATQKSAEADMYARGEAGQEFDAALADYRRALEAM